MFVNITQPFQLCHLPGQPHHSGQIVSHGQVQLAPGRAYQTLAFYWKAEKASVCTAKQDKASLFPSLSLSPSASKCGGFSRERKWQDYTHLPSLPTPFPFVLTKSSALSH